MPVPASFDYAVVRIVPRVERGEFLNAGVILFCRTRRYLGCRIAVDTVRLGALAPCVDPEEVEGHLAFFPLICEGAPESGPIGQLPQSQRFHWLTAPRSTVIQTSPVHSGLCRDPEEALAHLMYALVLPEG
jgi:hypothetical protein